MARCVCASIFCIIAAGALCPDIFMPKVYGLAESTAEEGSNAQAVHDLGEIGQGTNVGLISQDNTRITHEAFKDANGISHAFSYDFSGDGIKISNHDTWVAGIVASRGGASYPNDLGISPGVDIHSARVVNNSGGIAFSWVADALESLVNNSNCRVIVTGIALGDDANGQSDWTLLYDYYAYQHNVVFANPAGNSGSQITVFGDAYNGITTGGLILNDPNNEYVYRKVGSSSGSGPTADGRRKPDITAPSQNQTMPNGGSDTSWYTWTSADGATSFSAPHTAGVAALLLGLADDTSEPNDNQNEVIKAVIVNSTFPNIDDKSGNPTNPADPDNTWHPDRGYGRIDALNAYETLTQNRISENTTVTQQKGWAYDTIAAQQEHTYTISAQRHDHLVVTLTWDRKIEWIDEKQGFPPKKNEKIDTGELTAYPADLDLRVYEPNNSNAIYTGLSTDDNLEKCDLLLTTTGDYLIKVINNSTGENPDYGLAFEVLPPIPGDFDPVDYIVDYADMATLAQQWLLTNSDLEADLIPDGIINLPDFAEFANHWLETDSTYYQQP